MVVGFRGSVLMEVRQVLLRWIRKTRDGVWGIGLEPVVSVWTLSHTPSILPALYRPGLRTLKSYTGLYLFPRNAYTNSLPRTLPLQRGH